MSDVTTVSLVCAAALLHATDVLLAFALLVGFLHVAVDDVVRGGRGRAAVLTRLTIGAELDGLAVHHYDLAALLELTARHRAQASLHVRI